MIWPRPAAEGDAVSELLPGENFAVLEYAGGWAWGYCAADHVVGFEYGHPDPVPGEEIGGSQARRATANYDDALPTLESIDAARRRNPIRTRHASTAPLLRPFHPRRSRRTAGYKPSPDDERHTKAATAPPQIVSGLMPQTITSPQQTFSS